MAFDYRDLLQHEAESTFDPFEQTDFLVYETPSARTAPRSPSTPSTCCFWAQPLGGDSDSEAGPTARCFAAAAPAPAPQLPRQLRRPRSAILPRGNGAAAARAAAFEESDPAKPTVLQRRQELERGLKKDLRRSLRAVMEQEAASSAVRAAECTRRKKAEAREVEAKQRDIIARAVSRGSERLTVPPARDAPRSPQTSTRPASACSYFSAPASVATERRPDSPSSTSRSAESKQKPKALAFEQVKGAIEAAYDRPLLMHSYHRWRSHYEMLGVDSNATAAGIHAKVNTLLEAEQRQEGGGDPAKLQALVEAHTVLGDPQKRRDYDEGLTGKPCPRPSPGVEKLQERLNADLSERVEQRKQQAKTLERQRGEELQERIAKGAAKASLSHMQLPDRGAVKTVQECLEEKKVVAETVNKAQAVKLKECKVRGASREPNNFIRAASPGREDQKPPLKKSASSERYDATIAEKVAQKKEEMQYESRAQRQHIKEACARAKTSVPRPTISDDRRPLDEIVAERKAQMDMESKAMWGHIKGIRSRAASRERRPIAC